MKKWIACLLAAVMVLGLAACGGETPAPTETQQPQITTPQTENGTDRPETEPSLPPETTVPATESAGNPAYSMVFSAMDHPVIPALEQQSQGDYTVSKTPLDCDLEALITQLKTIPYLQENFTNLIHTTEESYEPKDDTKRTYGIQDTIALTGENDRSIHFVFSRNAANYSNYDSLYFYTSNTDLTAELQDALCQAYENAGLSMMKYLLTAQDPDGMTSYGSEMPEYRSADSMSEKVIAGDGVEYTLERDIDDELTDLSCRINIGYHSGWNANYTDGSFVSLLDTAPYDFSDLVSPDFGGSNPLDPASFGDKLLNSCFADYKQTHISEMVLTKVRYQDGATKYTFAMVLTYESTEVRRPAYFEYVLTYTDQDGALSNVDVSIHSYDLAQTRSGDSQEVLYNEVMRIVQTMIAGADVSAFSYENTRTMGERTIWRNDVSAVIFGQDVTIPDVMIIYDGEEMDLSLNLNLNIAAGLG